MNWPRPFAVALLMSASVIAAQPAEAQMVRIADDPRSVDLKNGQFGWDDRALAATQGGEVEMVISVPAQMAYIFRDGRMIGATTISTGKKGKATPLGLFEILQKREFHRSNLYSNAPMPFMQRLTWDGIALHGGDLPGYPASHGCIRMPNAFAKRLFALTAMGGRVLVTDQRMPQDSAPPTPPPVLTVSADHYESERYAFVTADKRLAPSPGQPLYAPNEVVAQPLR
ncbi:L,D-transpeptidase family protein [Sphingomonas sp. AX6]|uniref:L,D-transpeptidase family protein n=1 Tax=Sphingomonas sp. AX6 TaxID=2653171 RepID=UPI0012EF9827|nr:L,D-transpeptidase family protein [Sphingomonas sp. AX6]VXC91226.1 conserved exported hypothetical protein [Sphingomonas sp. AX6]